MDDIIDNLCSKIAKQIIKDPDLQIEAQEPLISGGLIDSFNLVDLAMMIEELYGVRIEDYELNADTFDTVEDLARLIVSRQ